MRVTVDDVTRLLSELVRIPSVNPRGREPTGAATGEAALADFVERWLTDRGVSAYQSDVLHRRPQVVATVAGRSARTLLLETHLDTVEVEGMSRPFDPYVRDGALYGRGACDAKGSLAAHMLVLAHLASSPAPPPVTVELAAVADEEHAYKGVLSYLAQQGPDAGRFIGAVVGEPTDLVPGTAHTGCVRTTISVTGQSGHSSKPSEAVNAIDIAARLIAHLTDSPVGSIAHPLLGKGTLTVTRVAAGEGPNVVPGYCEFDIDRRTVPGEDPDRILTDLRHELDVIAPGRVRVDDPFTQDIALDTPADAAVVTAAVRTLKRRGRAATPVGLAFGTDASKLSRFGIPSVVIGPGSIERAHTVQESVPLAEVRDMTEVISEIIESLSSYEDDS